MVKDLLKCKIIETNESDNERKLQIEDEQKNDLEVMFLQNYNCKEIESEKLKTIIKKLINEIIKEENLRFNKIK